jgi:hypothetical protein
MKRKTLLFACAPGPAALVAFVALRLTGVTSWPWWLILAPAWIPAVAAAVIVGFALAIIKAAGRS